MAQQFDVTSHSIYNWMKKYDPKAAEHQSKCGDTAKLRQLEKELKRVTEERDIPKKQRYTSPAIPT